jgi:hypothetical protein
MIRTFICSTCGNTFSKTYEHKGAKKHFCSRDCRIGINAPNWKRGAVIGKSGRCLVLTPGHPRANESGYVYRNILIAEKAIGKFLHSKYPVHHWKNIDDDHSIVICENKSYHKLLHRRKMILDLGGNPNTHEFCFNCKTIKSKEEFRDCYCKPCSYQLHKEWRERRQAA